MNFKIIACLLVGVLLWGLYEKAAIPKPIQEIETMTQIVEIPEPTQSLENNEILHQTESTPTPAVPADSPLPAVAVVIDDINSHAQLQKIDQLPIAITPAIMPNNTLNPTSSELHQNRDVYLVHLPLEAHKFKQKEHFVLSDSQSAEEIAKRIAEIHLQFPNARFLNNHTGSKFTEHRDSMRALLLALQKYQIVFLDSKTTSKSVAREVANSLGIRILERDVFLDYDKNMTDIAKQLHLAITIAKKRGYAIAIGHPYPETFAVLSQPQWQDLGVEFVYLDKLKEKIWQ